MCTVYTWTVCWIVNTGCPIKKATQAFGSSSRTRVPILFKFTMNIVQKMAKIIVTKPNSLDVLPHLECVLLRRLHFCCFHWTRRSLLKKFGWDHPKTRFDFEKCPEQKDKSLRAPLASNHDRNRLWDVRQVSTTTVRRTLGLPEVISRKWAYIERLF